MANYLLIESRDPFTSNDTSAYTELAMDLVKQGNDVTLFLVENGVFACRAAIEQNSLASIMGSKVEVLADSFSLRERGIGSSEWLEGVEAVEMDLLVDKIMDQPNTKVIWH